MSEPVDMPPPKVQPRTPSSSPGTQHLIPSPIPTRRERTYSQSQRAKDASDLSGVVRNFCREKGHGFIDPKDKLDTSEPLFVHISDIEGEFVPLPGDEVKFRTVLCPPKREKLQAVHVRIVHLKEGVEHHRWDGTPVRTSFS